MQSGCHACRLVYPINDIHAPTVSEAEVLSQYYAHCGKSARATSGYYAQHVPKVHRTCESSELYGIVHFVSILLTTIQHEPRYIDPPRWKSARRYPQPFPRNVGEGRLHSVLCVCFHDVSQETLRQFLVIQSCGIISAKACLASETVSHEYLFH